MVGNARLVAEVELLLAATLRLQLEQHDAGRGVEAAEPVFSRMATNADPRSVSFEAPDGALLWHPRMLSPNLRQRDSFCLTRACPRASAGSPDWPDPCLAKLPAESPGWNPDWRLWKCYRQSPFDAPAEPSRRRQAGHPALAGSSPKSPRSGVHTEPAVAATPIRRTMCFSRFASSPHNPPRKH